MLSVVPSPLGVLSRDDAAAVKPMKPPSSNWDLVTLLIVIALPDNVITASSDTSAVFDRSVEKLPMSGW